MKPESRATHEPERAFYILYRCKRCGKLSPNRTRLELTECPAVQE